LDLKVSVIAPGKLILLGEYAVLQGAHALVAAVNRHARVEVTNAISNYCELITDYLPIKNIKFKFDMQGKILFIPDIDANLRNILKFFIETCESSIKFLQSYNKSISPCIITLDTSQFFSNGGDAKLGLGSSAALTVALFTALAKFSGFLVSKSVVFFNTLKIHHRAQGGMGSGIDIAASVFGGVLDYKMSLEKKILPKKTEIVENIYIVPIWSGQSTSTKEYLALLHSFRDNNEQSYEKIMHRLIELADSGCYAYKTKNCTNFMHIVTDYYGTLKHLSEASGVEIISQDHRSISQIVEDAGGVYKPSGAGGGDFGLAFCLSKKIVKNVRSAITKSKYKIIDLQITDQGVRVY
jgi:phosphomevalonate kinase